MTLSKKNKPTKSKNRVDLDEYPAMPGAEGWFIPNGFHQKGGKDVRVERRGDDLYVDNKRIVFYLTEKQSKETVVKTKRRWKNFWSRIYFLLKYREIPPRPPAFRKRGKMIGGRDLRKELESKPVKNAALLNHLLDYPELIPDVWDRKEDGKNILIFFWGTVYQNQHGDLVVRYLSRIDGKWRSNHYGLEGTWYANHPAAISEG